MNIHIFIILKKMEFDEKGYEYVLYLLKKSNYHILNENKHNIELYDMISVIFTEPHTHQYKLEPYGEKVTINDAKDTNKIETKYMSKYLTSPYLLVKFTDDKFGYIHKENFDPVEFESQEEIKNKLLEFLSNIYLYKKN